LQRVTILCAAAIGGAAVMLSVTPALSARAAASKPAVKQDGAPVRGLNQVRGLDVSAYQHQGAPINWNSLAKQGMRFAAIKVSEGTYYVNRYYRLDAQAAAKSGLVVLPYVFANPSRANGPATAQFAVRAAGKQRGHQPFVVDLENDPYKKATDCYGLKVPAMTAWIAGFISKAEALTGQAPIIYTTAAWWAECTGNTARFRGDPLWLAAFGGTPPTVPPPWARWTFWQYNSRGSLPGVGQTDLDFFQPTSAFPASLLAGPHAAKKPAKLAKPAKQAKPPKQAKPTKQPRQPSQAKHSTARPPAKAEKPKAVSS